MHGIITHVKLPNWFTSRIFPSCTGVDRDTRALYFGSAPSPNALLPPTSWDPTRHDRFPNITEGHSTEISNQGSQQSLNNRNFMTFFTRVLIEIVCFLFFDIVPLLRNTLCSLVHKLADALYKKLFGMAFNQLCTTSITSLSSANFWPCKCSFTGPKKWKSDGAKSGPYGGCFNTPNFRSRVSTVCAAVWGRALSWHNTLFERSSRCFDRIAGFNSFTSMSLYWALVTFWPFSWKCTNIGPLTSQKTVSMTFPAEACVLNFLLAGEDGCFHYIGCLLLCGS